MCRLCTCHTHLASSDGGMLCCVEPFEVEVSSPNAEARGQGWVLPATAAAKGSSTLLLNEAGTARVQYSPALAE